MRALQRVERRYLASDPCELEHVVRRPDLDGKGTHHDLVWKRYVAPPHEIGLIVGDAIHNLRSALDHLTLQLALYGAIGANATLTAKEEIGIQFPIVLTEDEFKQQLRRGRLRHVRNDARAAIEGAQPYKTLPLTPGLAPLAILNRLDNADKHRTLVLGAPVVRITHHLWPDDARSSQGEYPRERFTGKPGTVFMTYRFDTPKSKMEVPVELSYGLVTGDFIPLNPKGATDWLRSQISSVTLLIENLSAGHLP
jgi:hypothetical protein